MPEANEKEEAPHHYTTQENPLWNAERIL